MIFFQLPSTLWPQLRDPKIYKAFSIVSTSSQHQSREDLPPPQSQGPFLFHTSSILDCQFESKPFVFSVTFSHTDATRQACVFDGFGRESGGSEEWEAFGAGAQWGPEPRLCVSYSFFPSALCPSQCQERKRNKSVSETQTSSQGASLFFQGVLDKDGNHSVFPN